MDNLEVLQENIKKLSDAMCKAGISGEELFKKSFSKEKPLFEGNNPIKVR